MQEGFLWKSLSESDKATKHQCANQDIRDEQNRD